MSYDQKYNEWVEKVTKIEATRAGESSKVYKIYQGIPIIRSKVKDYPPQYHYLSPLATGKDIIKLQEKIDKILNKANQPKKPVIRTAVPESDATYFQKWQDCQIELDDLKRREAKILSRVDELQAQVNQLSSEQARLRKEATDLRGQLKASEDLVKELQNKK